MTHDNKRIISEQVAEKIVNLLEKTGLQSAYGSKSELLDIANEVRPSEERANLLAMALLNAVESIGSQQTVGEHTEYLGLTLQEWKQDWFPVIQSFASQAEKYYAQIPDSERTSPFFKRLAEAIDRVRAADERQGVSWAGRVDGTTQAPMRIG
jgi:hypothetical protein